MDTFNVIFDRIETAEYVPLFWLVISLIDYLGYVIKCIIHKYKIEKYYDISGYQFYFFESTLHIAVARFSLSFVLATSIVRCLYIFSVNSTNIEKILMLVFTIIKVISIVLSFLFISASSPFEYIEKEKVEKIKTTNENLIKERDEAKMNCLRALEELREREKEVEQLQQIISGTEVDNLSDNFNKKITAEEE